MSYKLIGTLRNPNIFHPGLGGEWRGDGGGGPGLHRLQWRHCLDARKLFLGHTFLLHADHSGHWQVSDTLIIIWRMNVYCYQHIRRPWGHDHGSLWWVSQNFGQTQRNVRLGAAGWDLPVLSADLYLCKTCTCTCTYVNIAWATLCMVGNEFLQFLMWSEGR